MQNARFFALCILLAILLPYTYGGCSGVASNNENDTGLSYTGINQPAEIGDSNAPELLGAVLGAGLIRDRNPGLGAGQALIAQRNGNFRSYRIPLVLIESAKSIPFEALMSSDLVPTETQSEPVEGSCGGNISYTITMVDVWTGMFEGRLTFSEYCEYGITLNGTVNFNGLYSLKLSELREVNFSFDNLVAIVFQVGRLQFDGEISIDLTTFPLAVTLNVFARDYISGKVYYVDYLMAVNEYAGFVEIEISGEFYFPDHGYVRINTPEPFLLHDEDVWPTSGVIIITGASDSSARLTVIDRFTCIIEVDFDGDGNYDWTSGVISWEDL